MRFFELPPFLDGVVTHEAYVRWLQRKAAAHIRRDRKRGNTSGTVSEYKRAIHQAVCSSRGRDAYTGEQLAWNLISTYNKFDTHWARIYSEHLRDKKLYEEHVEKKAETEEWKRSTRERARQNLPPKPKPHRIADEQDQQLLKVRSQIKTDLLTLGLDPEKFRIAERLRGLRSKDETRRLIAATELAEARFLHALATGAETHKVYVAESQAQALASDLRDTLTARKEAERQKPEGEKKPLLFYRTTKQEAELKTLNRERLKAARDDSRAGILAGQIDLFRARAETSQKEASEFAKHGNLVTFEVRKGEA